MNAAYQAHGYSTAANEARDRLDAEQRARRGESDAHEVRRQRPSTSLPPVTRTTTRSTTRSARRL
jgi:hypothetical protein